MANIYFSIAEITSLKNSYAVKKIEINRKLRFPNEIFNFDIEDAKLIYVGEYNRSHEVYQPKIEFHLSRYKTKINKDIYKIDFIKLIGRIRYECQDVFIHSSISESIISKSSELECVRQDKFENPKELTEIEANYLIEKYNDLEDKWLEVWKDVYFRLEAFFNKHPKPQKVQYYRTGLSSMLFGNFRKEDFSYDSRQHYEKLKWVCEKLTDEFIDLNLSFMAECPNGCRELLPYELNFEYESTESSECLENLFQFYIYKKLNFISCSCSECGSFKISFNDEYTSAFRNYQPEILNFVAKRILQDHIAHYIEKKLYSQVD